MIKFIVLFMLLCSVCWALEGAIEGETILIIKEYKNSWDCNFFTDTTTHLGTYSKSKFSFEDLLVMVIKTRKKEAK